MKINLLTIFLSILLSSSLHATELNSKDDIKVVSSNKVVRIKISEDLNEPLSVFLFDKRGNQLNYKYWEKDRSRTIEFQVPEGMELKSYTIEVTENGKSIFRKSFKSE